jgi:uncharacterized membrane protein
MKNSPHLYKTAFLFFLILILILSASPVFAQYFTINEFRSDITVREDSSFVVNETLRVTFHKPRHGIYRDIPFKYVTELGKVIRTPIKVISVRDDSGRTWKYKVSKTGPLIRIRIGDPNKYVRGNQTYVITYRMQNAILFFDDHDELYWNVTGNYWKAPIQEASADIHLDVGQKSGNLWQGCYTGVLGSTASECEYDSYDNGSRFVTKRNLNAGEGFTIAFGWDKGLVSPPSGWVRFLWAINVEENWIFLFSPLAMITMLWLWRRKGRDPKVRESIAVMYEPPKFDQRPLTPGEVGTLVDERLDRRDITSTIVGLAVKGYIRIEETKKEGVLFDSADHYLKKMKSPDENLSAFETELMKSLFPAGLPGTLVSSLKNKFYTNLDILKRTLYGELVRKKYFLINPEKVRSSYVVTGIIIMVAGAFVFAWLTPGSVGKGIFAAVLTGLPVLGFGRVMPAKTRAGALAHSEILGFQEFLNRAEKDRLERMGDKDLFSKFLPYAIALGVADNWAKAFEGIFQNPPQWYVSPGGFRTFYPYSFAHSLNSMTSDLSSAMFSAPRGSGVSGGGGGGGGGFSGGGFGGGGGGSW